MTRPAHTPTPGPWRRDENFPGCVWAGDEHIACVDREPNAHLIAAAPDLLAVADRVRPLVAGLVIDPDSRRLLDTIDAAIAKASAQAKKPAGDDENTAPRHFAQGLSDWSICGTRVSRPLGSGAHIEPSTDDPAKVTCIACQRHTALKETP